MPTSAQDPPHADPSPFLDRIAGFREACQRDEPRGCERLAEAYMSHGVFGRVLRRNEPEALRLYIKACELDDAYCFPLAEAHLMGTLVAKDDRRGIALLERACAAEEYFACSELAERYDLGRGVPQDRRAALAIL